MSFLFLIITSSLSSRFVVGCQPGEAFVKAVASSGTSGLNMPVAVTHPCKTQLFLNFVRFHGWKFEKIRLNEKSFALWIYRQTFCHRKKNRQIARFTSQRLIRCGFTIFQNFFCVFLPPGKSCLLAKMRIIASRISLSLIILCSSWRASSMRSRSAQSTTKIRPCVPV